MELHQALLGAGEALLIGFLIGAQREASRGESEKQPGIRDFTLIALVGALSALLGSDALAVCALVALAVLLAVYHYQVKERSGVTTEVAAVTTFFLGYLTATPRLQHGTLVAVSLTIAVLFLLDAKVTLHNFVRRTITETEFRDTIRFLALVFIIYPVLPEEPMGPYGFFHARKVWLFVILVCSISYFGYFLRKFAGEHAGANLAGVLGGIASSTAATVAFARMSSTASDESGHEEGAAIISNTLQFPRILVLLYIINHQVAQACVWPLLAMTAAGGIFSLVRAHGRNGRVTPPTFINNPFSLGPALTFGALLTAVLFLSRAALEAFGTGSIQWVGLLSGLADADAVLLAVAELYEQAGISIGVASCTVLLALAANAITKSVIAVIAGTRRFARGLLVAFAGIFTAGGVAWLVQSALQ